MSINILISKSGGGEGSGGEGSSKSKNQSPFLHTFIYFHNIWTQGYHGKFTHVT